MTDQTAEPPLRGPAARGAVDLTGMAPPASSPAAARPDATTGRAGVSGLLVEGTDANFSEVVNASIRVPSVVVLWSSAVPPSAEFVGVVVQVAAALDGRLQVISVDVDANPGLLRAFQVQSVPMTLGLVQGQPVPLFAGVQPQEQVRAYVDELLKLAVQYGITGRVDVSDAPPPRGEEEPELPPLHKAAFDAIDRGDLDGATEAYERALADNPADVDAQLGLAQVSLMRRTEGVDPAPARAAAAADRHDVDAAILVADLDVLDGRVEEAFGRLVDLVRTTAGDDRERVRTHLLELFSVVGSHDERVRKARTALMSALF
jgi:putative thioredoxin